MPKKISFWSVGLREEYDAIWIKLGLRPLLSKGGKRKTRKIR
jgi:hypothetical protein